MAMEQYSRLKVTFDEITGAMKLTGQEAVSLQKQVRLLKQELTLGSYTDAQFKQIQKALAETEIKLQQTQLRGKDLLLQIGTLGGPIGEMSNRIDRFIKLIGALNDISFDELKQQFKNLYLTFTGQAGQISDVIDVAQTGGRKPGVRESVGDAGRAGSGLQAGAAAAQTGAAAATVGAAKASIDAAAATDLYTKALASNAAENFKVIEGSKKLRDAYVHTAVDFKNGGAEIVTAQQNIIDAVKKRQEYEQSLINVSSGQKKIIQDRYKAEQEANFAASQALKEYVFYNQDALKAAKLLEEQFKDVSFVVQDGAIMIGVHDQALRALTDAENAAIISGKKLIITEEGLIAVETKGSLVTRALTVITTLYGKAVQLLSQYIRFATLNVFGFITSLRVADVVAKITLGTLTLLSAVVGGLAAGFMLIGPFVQYITGFAKASAAASQLKRDIEALTEVLDLNLSSIKRANSEELAEMKTKNATSEQLRKKELESYKNGLKLIEDALEQSKDKVNKAQEQSSKSGGFFGVDSETAQQQVDNVKKSGDQLLKLQEQRLNYITEGNNKFEANTEATIKEGINNRIKAIDAEMEQQIYSTETSSKELIKLYKERNRLVDYLDKDHKLTLVERNERTRIQNLKINNATIDDDVRVIQARIDAQQRLVDSSAKNSEEEFEARKQVVEENFNKEMAEAKRNEQTREQNEKNALTKKNKALRDINISELTASEDLQQTFLNGAIKGLESYYDTQVELENTSYKKRQAEFKGNAKKLEALEKEHTQKLQDIQVQRLASREDLIQHFLNAESENTVHYFDLQRDLENAAYVKQQEAAKGNYQLLEALRLEHLKKMGLIDASEFENKAQMLQRKSQTEYFDVKNNNLKLKEVNQKIYEDKVASEEIHFEAEKKKAGTNTELLAQIQLEHNQTLAQIGADRVETEQQVNLKIEEVAGQFGAVMSQLGNILLQDAQGRDEKKFKQAKKMAIAGIGIEKAAAIASIWTNTYIANAKMKGQLGIFGIPLATLNTISAVLSTAAAIAAAAQAMSAINGVDFQSADKGSGRHYASGGMINGARHSDGGVPIEAEGGEAVMTRGAVTAFAPLLSMLNVAGGGTSFSQGAVGQAGYDNPTRDGQQLQQQQITKTYVVEQELTTMQQRQARLKNLSTL
jgi:hypothetical protein